MGYKEPLYLIKIGGNIIDRPDDLDQFLETFGRIPGKKILVHGGGKVATELAKKLEIPQTLVEGRRITDADTLKLVTMVYGGLINKNIVAKLSVAGITAVGLSGADAGTVLAEKRRVREIDYGFVGDIRVVGAGNIDKLLRAGFIPVFCAITTNREGQLLNTNADTLASEIAYALSGIYDVRLFFCFEQNGVLEDIKKPDSVIPVLPKEEYKELKEEGKIFAGMIPKLDNAYRAVDRGIGTVYVLSAQNVGEVIIENKKYGTRVTG